MWLDAGVMGGCWCVCGDDEFLLLLLSRDLNVNAEEEEESGELLYGC